MSLYENLMKIQGILHIIQINESFLHCSMSFNWIVTFNALRRDY